MRFEFATATRILFGPGILREAGSIAREQGRSALVVTGRHRERAARLLELLNEHGVAARVFSVAGEPEIQTIESGVQEGKHAGCDLVIAMGGGSAIDSGKAIAAMLANGGALLDYLEIIGHGQALTKPSIPFIAIPTTAGTGSEVTRNSVLASPGRRVKVSLRSPLMLPRVALVDPELTYELPPAITASTGLDALTQLIEPYVCSRSNPLTDSFCLDGIRRVAPSLRAAFENGRDAAAREAMASASLFGGLALANSGLGAVHGLAGPIGGMFPAPHGAICAALLPHVMSMNIRALRRREPSNPALERYAAIAELLTRRPAPEAGVEWTQKLIEDLRIPKLRAYGIGPKDFPELVGKAASASSMKANPIALTADELVEVLESAV